MKNVKILFSLCGLFLCLVSCNESLQLESEKSDALIGLSSNCNPSGTTHEASCCIIADAFPPFPGYESAIDFGDGTIVILDQNLDTEHCYDSPGIYTVISTLKDPEGNIIEESCEEFFVQCLPCCDLVSIDYEEISNDGTCCQFEATVNNPTDCTFELAIDQGASQESLLIAPNSNSVIDGYLEICNTPASMILTSNDPENECSKSFESIVCESCCDKAADFEISYCLDKVEKDKCFIKIKIFNTTDCEFGVFNQIGLIGILPANRSYELIVNPEDLNSYHIRNSLNGPACLEIPIPTCNQVEKICID